MSDVLHLGWRYGMIINIDINDDEIDNLMDFMDMMAGRTLDITTRQGSVVYEILSRVVEASSIQQMQSRGKK
jgi:hypothetical protein